MSVKIINPAVTAADVQALGVKGLALLNLLADIENQSATTSKELFDLFYPVIGMEQNFKKGGAPHITGKDSFCDKVYILSVGEDRLKDEKGKFIAYTTAADHNKFAPAIGVKSLGRWIERNAATLFSTVTEEIVDGKPVEKVVHQFATIAKDEELKELNSFINAVNHVSKSKYLEPAEKTALDALFAGIIARIQGEKDARTTAQKEQIAALEKAQKGETEEAGIIVDKAVNA